MATLDLADSPQTLVWRLIRDRLMADVALNSVIRTWLVWDASPAEGTDIDALAPPAMRIYPLAGPMSWMYPNSQAGPLFINIEASTPSLDVEDVLNLQFAIERSLYPADPAEERAFEASLVAAGAVTGLIVFDEPIGQSRNSLPLQDQGGFRPVGRFRIDVLRQLLV